MPGQAAFTHAYPNGLTLVAEPVAGARSAAFHLLVPAGAITDPDGLEGSATVIENLCYRGAGPRDARALSDELDGLGVQRGGGADAEYSTFAAALLADDLETALELYSDIVLRPHLPGDQLDAARDFALQRLQSLEDNPTHKLFVELARLYFPGPYGRSSLGTRDGLERLTIEDVTRDHRRRYSPSPAILSVAGRFEWERLRDQVGRIFGEWQGAAQSLPPPDTTGRPPLHHIPQETAQEQIGVAYPEVTLGRPGFYESRLAVEVLSGGMGARLFTEVREKRGLVYSVSARARSLKGAGVVLCYAGTTPERSQETLDVLLGELRRLPDGVTEEEVARAKTGLLSSLVMQGESTVARVGALARDQFLLGRIRSLDEIRAEVERVTADGVTAHLRTHPPGDFTVVTLGPREIAPSS